MYVKKKKVALRALTFYVGFALGIQLFIIVGTKPVIFL